MNINSNTIILCGGKINYVNLPINSNTNNSMIPVNGKPVISWIIDDLIQKNIKLINIVLRAENKHLKEFVQRVYQNKIDLKITEISDSSTILHSLLAGLQIENLNFPSRIILGDTLIKDDYENIQDLIYVQEVEDCQRWCVASFDQTGIVEKYYDKQENVPFPHFALCGYYYFTNTEQLYADLNKCISENKKQMSDLLTEYQLHFRMHAIEATEWFDFGNIDNMINAKQRLLQSRFFNTLKIDPILNTITKVSEYDKKLRDELNWYNSLPAKLKVLTPRIISAEEYDGKLNLVQEYYGYPTLAELYLFSDLELENWQSIFKKLLTLHRTFEEYSSELTSEELNQIYFYKTFERIESLLRNDYWKKLLSEQIISFNGKHLKNIFSLKNLVQQKCEDLASNSKGCIIHGDFCFSNILYDLNNQIIRIIDPRGSFGKTGIYGDPRYDMAKLRHSVCGKYDYIISDLFEINETESGFEGTIFCNNYNEDLSGLFDKQLTEFGYDVNEIEFIEGLLFISMLPLHNDKPQRQKMMFVTGLEKLNKILCA